MNVLATSRPEKDSKTYWASRDSCDMKVFGLESEKDFRSWRSVARSARANWSSRLLRSGKQAVSNTAAPLLERLRIDADSWAATLQRFFSGDKLVGNFFGSASRLQEATTAKGRRWLKDLGHRAPLAAAPPIT